MAGLYRIVYTSHQTTQGSAEDRVADVATVLSSGREHNDRADLTSVLALHRGRFAQIIEGSRDAAEATFARIRVDRRHRDVQVLQAGPIEGRGFPGCALVLIGHSALGRSRLDDLARRSGADLGRAEPSALMATFTDVLAQETGAETLPVGDVAVGAPETPWRPLDGRDRPNAEREALDAVFATAVFSADRRILRANARFEALFGYGRGALAGRDLETIVHHDDRGRLDSLWAAMARGRPVSVDHRGIGRDGGEVWLRGSFSPRLDDAGALMDVVEIASDVTEAQRQRASERGQIAAIAASQAVIHFSLDGIVEDANAVFLDAMGYRRDEIVGRHDRMFLTPEEGRHDAYAAFWADLAKGRLRQGEYRRVGRDGRDVWLKASYHPILDMNGRPSRIVSYATDVTAEKLQRVAFEGQVDAVRKSHGIITFDMGGTILDVNDRMLASLGYERDALLGRHHSVLVDPAQVDAPDYAVFWDTLRAGTFLSGLYERRGKDGRIVWIQASYNPILDFDGRPLKVIKIASDVSSQVALVGAYEDTRRQTQHDSATNDRILAYRALVDDMRRGLAADEFFLEYQPRFTTRDGRLQSVEALVRWRHPQRGRVNPADFIPLAEKSGLIAQLGTWVLRTACRAAAAWDGIGVSVNVSPVQFRSGDLVPIVTQALADAGLDPHRLELEITEGVLLENAERAGTELNALKARGVKLAMDDFGTGYSSLSSLRSFPFDVIKIDRHFVADMDVRQGGREVVQAILGLGRALGLSVTAEGVETPTQLMMLTLDGCQEVQGYLLARPLAVEAVTERLMAGEAAARTDRA